MSEICYPFIYEESQLCDYEIATDLLSSQIGLARSLLVESSPLRPTLLKLVELVYHMNGSLRGRNALTSDDLNWIKSLNQSGVTVKRPGVFSLPHGCPAAATLHVARCQAKHVVRILGQLKGRGMSVPDDILSFANHVANALFRFAEQANQEAGVPEVEFVSKSYGRTESHQS